MKFLCDVHISYKLVSFLKKAGFETLHINEILNKSETTDKEICNFADNNDFVVVSKDSDFRDSHFINKSPKKLIKINLGNISNLDLIEIFNQNLNYLTKLNTKNTFLIEIDIDSIQITEV